MDVPSVQTKCKDAVLLRGVCGGLSSEIHKEQKLRRSVRNVCAMQLVSGEAHALLKLHYFSSAKRAVCANIS
ncbi:hypothetical protein T4B_7777 [Trichinella pseudospiralis]|uniref:Uncharacterized protein n=1 Tax=Trichinella pseudospiralis TaxID=6337 RepID=A0A0V1GS08_TRIPS|nr:hypothetical protein T4A_10911 [Trichinella pseudospiralis]KRZ00761.1 hypothetical protein T4B_5211 [Trichinella pseudospiralis]KRZ00771.1 hypothetical protein T4B_12041 [Trichinella pseudospiralis]KRZ04784.1 hypothetical protein T4B_7777 [Trichinella pseudospiralis]KRZ25768.1 hypothetical protein T4C_4486 [Trichinella pseudospiralis]